MLPLTAREVLDHQVVRVTATMHPEDLKEQREEGPYAVLGDEDGQFLGLVTGKACARFPYRIFADIVRHEVHPTPVGAETSAEVVLQRMEEEGGAEVLPVIDDQGAFVGIITRRSLLEAFLARERERLFEQVRAGRERLRTLSRRLVEMQEAERRHIARELHDEIGQVLTGLKLTLDMATQQCRTNAAKTSLGKAQALVNDVMVRVRELSLDLRPTMLDDMGLLPALLWHFERYTAQTGVRVVFEQAGLTGRFAPDIETAAYRIVQEALTNVARHADVNEVTVSCWSDPGVLRVQIQDRGAGFDPEAALAVNTTGGLAGMRERAELLGGHLALESAPGKGTRVIVELPLSDRLERRKHKRGA